MSKLETRQSEVEKLLTPEPTTPPGNSVFNLVLYVAGFAVSTYIGYKLIGWLFAKGPEVAAVQPSPQAAQYVQQLARNNEVTDTIANLYRQLQSAAPK